MMMCARRCRMREFQPDRRPILSQHQPCNAQLQGQCRFQKLRPAEPCRHHQHMVHRRFMALDVGACSHRCAFKMHVAPGKARCFIQRRAMAPHWADRAESAQIAPHGKGHPQIWPSCSDRGRLQHIDLRTGGQPIVLTRLLDVAMQIGRANLGKIDALNPGKLDELPHCAGVGEPAVCFDHDVF